jgi:hypothetical protein
MTIFPVGHQLVNLTDWQVILSVIAVPGDDGTDAQERLLRLERNLEQRVSVVNGDVEALKADLKTLPGT